MFGQNFPVLLVSHIISIVGCLLAALPLLQTFQKELYASKPFIQQLKQDKIFRKTKFKIYLPTSTFQIVCFITFTGIWLVLSSDNPENHPSFIYLLSPSVSLISLASGLVVYLLYKRDKKQNKTALSAKTVRLCATLPIVLAVFTAMLYIFMIILMIIIMYILNSLNLLNEFQGNIYQSSLLLVLLFMPTLVLILLQLLTVLFLPRIITLTAFIKKPKEEEIKKRKTTDASG